MERSTPALKYHRTDGVNPFLSSWKPYGLITESASADFHALRKDFSPHRPTHITQKSGQQNALSIWRGTSQHADYDANQGEVSPIPYQHGRFTSIQGCSYLIYFLVFCIFDGTFCAIRRSNLLLFIDLSKIAVELSLNIAMFTNLQLESSTFLITCKKPPATE